MAENTEVVVVGGGYAGVLAANRLTQRDDVSVTLVNPRPTFVERIRLHQLVGGSHEAVVAYADVLAEGVRLIVDSAERIDADHRTVTLGGGTALAYDYLVYAVGSASASPQVEGAAEHAYPISTLEEATRLRVALTTAADNAPVTVVGAGPSGIETAAELAEAGRTVTLVCGGELGPYLHPKSRRALARRLAGLGVTVLDGPETTVTRVTSDAVALADGTLVPSVVTIWTTGFGVPDLARRSGLTTDPVGRLATDETLTSVDDDRIVAAGDSVAPSGAAFRMSCQAAGPLGAHAADTVLARIAGEQVTPVEIGFIGQCLSIGRQAGLFQFAHSDDTARAFHIGGRTGARLKELVCWSTVKQLAWEARHPGRFTMPGWAADHGRAHSLAERPETTPVG